MHLRPVTAAVLAAAVCAVAVPASAAAAPTAPSQRPHSRVVTYDRAGVRVPQLQADVHRVGRRLRVHAAVEVRNDGATPITRYVQVGRCVKGAGYAPRCPTSARFALRVGAGRTARLVRDVTVRQPPPSVDAVEVSLTSTRAQASPYAFRTNGQLLLKGNAWRGAGAGRVYGVAFPAGDDRATRLSFDIPVVAPGEAYISLVWNGAAAPGAATTIARCTGADCVARPLKPARSRSGPQRFGARFDEEIQGADALAVEAHDTDGTPLLTAALPWPA